MKTVEEETRSGGDNPWLWIINNALISYIAAVLLKELTPSFYFTTIIILCLLSKLYWNFFQDNIGTPYTADNNTLPIEKNVVWFIMTFFRFLIAIYTIPIVFIVAIIEMLISFVIMLIAFPFLAITYNSHNIRNAPLMKNLNLSFVVVNSTIKRGYFWIIQTKNTSIFYYINLQILDSYVGENDRAVWKSLTYFTSWILLLYFLFSLFTDINSVLIT